MIGLLLRRLAVVGPVLLAASVLVFALPRLVGVDPARAVLRARSAEAVPDPAAEATVGSSSGWAGPPPSSTCAGRAGCYAETWAATAAVCPVSRPLPTSVQNAD